MVVIDGFAEQEFGLFNVVNFFKVLVWLRVIIFV